MPRALRDLPLARLASSTLLALVLLALAAGPGLAGAWPRGQGQLFAAASHYANPGGGYSGLFLHYGLTPRLGVGLDWGRSVSGREKAVLFLHRPLRNGKLAIAAELGLGVIDRRRVVRPGLSIGRSITLGGRDGWIAADALAELGRDGGLDLKADLTLGITVSPRLTGLMQLQMGHPRHDPPFLRAVPSVLWRLKGGAQVEFGLTQDLRGGGTGLKLGFWRQF